MVAFILGLILIGSAAVYMNLGLSGVWSAVLGFVTALVLGPAVDTVVTSLKGGDDKKHAGDDSVS
jgi:hypothetical protein